VKTLQERLIYARTAAGLTQAQLAKMAGCSQSAIGNVESGTRSHIKNIFDVANALNCRAEWLQEGTGTMRERSLDILPGFVNEVRENVTPFQAYDWPFSFTRRRYVSLPENLRARADAYITGIIEAFEGGAAGRTKKEA